MKNFVKYCCKKIYEIGYFAYQADVKKERDRELNKNATIGSDCYFGNDAWLQNSTQDKSRIVIGDETSIMGHLMTFKHGGQIIIGDHCFVGKDTRIWSAKKIQIGDRVLIAHNVNIHDNISHPLNAHNRHLDFVHIRQMGLQEKVDLNEKEVIIEDDAWIGFNSTILKGVRIGKGAIIGACTLITHDVPDYAVVIGNPARIIRYNN